MRKRCQLINVDVDVDGVDRHLNTVRLVYMIKHLRV